MTNENVITLAIGKIGATKEIDLKAFPQESNEFIFQYGLRQLVNDCHASIKRADFESDEAFINAVNERVNAKILQIMEGKLSMRSGKRAEPVDPVQKIIHRIAKEAVKQALGKKGVKLKDLPEGKFDELVDSYIASREEELTTTAKAELKRQEKFQADIDLGDLGL
jgi:hypothetical protein